MFEASVEAGVLQIARRDTAWLSTGWDGGFERADAAYNVSVPEGWSRTDLGTYVTERCDRAGFDLSGPSLLTGVDLQHARGARLDSVVAYATAGVSNPAALPQNPLAYPAQDADTDGRADEDGVGTVNIVVGTTRALDDAGLANLLAVAVEAKAATLLAATGFPGTTTDAVVVGCDPDGDPAQFTGSATPVGAAARACVREAVRASLASRYEHRAIPSSVADAEYGVVTDRRAEVFSP
ncbi:adenosylcobinamide amidohydrolase [Halococcus saccharolyticus]|uniref:Adenosylcobinamide amidohydrolase n=1 Tax=Halococcus saccharolyticus DSM 5350 TaxID=1227455 RepID=M0MK79_9EURY|nr:adenosylcobinamide amidohydrolase [Halococcus saccharolyticus]EMA44855.1 adenosylcobinamide amidohydrolase [Halococcus saccharolyticus DSM 5350]